MSTSDTYVIRWGLSTLNEDYAEFLNAVDPDARHGTLLITRNEWEQIGKPVVLDSRLEKVN